jgi:hypothetical protein
MNASMIARSFFSGVLGSHHVSDDAVIWFLYIFSQMKVILELRGLECRHLIEEEPNPDF